MELGKKLFNQGYRFYTDSFYTTKYLADDLLLKRLYLIGAMKRTSSAMPDCLKDIVQFEKCSTRGDFRWHRDSNFVFVQWRDCKTVTILSPIHRGSAVSECERTVNERSGYKKKKLVQPAVIKDYNSHMGGVDKSNQMLNKYPCYIKSIFHWWKVLFFHSIDIMVVNSFIILTECIKEGKCAVDGVSSSFGQLEFRESIAQSLLEPCITVVERTLTHKSCMPEVSDTRKDCVFCNGIASLQGFKVPSIKTQYYCIKCKVPLCFNKDRNCFRKWHSPEGVSVQEWARVKGRKRKV